MNPVTTEPSLLKLLSLILKLPDDIEGKAKRLKDNVNDYHKTTEILLMPIVWGVNISFSVSINPL